MGGARGICSSYDVFMSFVTDGNEASDVLSLHCFNRWVATRRGTLKQPEESFRRVLTAHVCGLIGRKPFPPEVEESLLTYLRKKHIWPCFKDKFKSNGAKVTIGIKGFRKFGFHESRKGIFGNFADTASSPRAMDTSVAQFRRESTQSGSSRYSGATQSSFTSISTAAYSLPSKSVSRSDGVAEAVLLNPSSTANAQLPYFEVSNSAVSAVPITQEVFPTYLYDNEVEPLILSTGQSHQPYTPFIRNASNTTQKQSNYLYETNFEKYTPTQVEPEDAELIMNMNLRMNMNANCYQQQNYQPSLQEFDMSPSTAAATRPQPVMTSTMNRNWNY